MYFFVFPVLVAFRLEATLADGLGDKKGVNKFVGAEIIISDSPLFPSASHKRLIALVYDLS